MRVILAVGLGVITVCVFSAVTMAVFIAQHIFASALLAGAVTLALFMRHRSRIHRQRFAAHPPTSYPATAAPPTTRAPIPRFPTGAMSSAALRRRAPRTLPYQGGGGHHG
jgi:hypothetical protein